MSGIRPPLVEKHVLDEGIVLHHSRMAGLVFLDAFASYCFCVAEVSRSDAEVIAAVQRELGVGARSEQIGTLLRIWRRLGVLPYGGMNARQPRFPNPASLPPLCTPIVLPAADRDRAPVYEILGNLFRVVCSNARLSSEISTAFGHLHARRTIRRPITGFDFRLQPSGNDIVLRGHGREWWRGSRVEAVPALKSTVFSIAVDAKPYLASIHAAAVSRGDRCILLAGASGSGKSLLTVALGCRGYSFLGDDCILLDRRLLALGVPMPIAIKRSGVRVAEEMLAAIGAMPEHIRYDGQPVRYWFPEERAEPRRLPVHAVAFVQYQRDGPDDLKLLSAFAGFKRLTELMQIRRPMRRSDVSALVPWAKAVKFAELRFSTHAFADTAIAALSE